MNRLQFMIFSLFAVALSTGIVVGMTATRSTAAPVRHDRSWLADELDLSPEQSEKMRVVWSEMLKTSGQKHADRHEELQQERDAALVALLSSEQKEKYAAIVEHYNQATTELRKERDAEFASAVERTKEILSDSQRKRYEELLKQGYRGGPFSRGPGGNSTRPGGHRDGPGPADRR